ncbi:MAG: type II toxin-antitoxin system ParD family antitoxin [Steroidobacteraceae bacterium]
METQNAEKLSITLPAEMVRVIRERVSSGDYGSTSEVVREAMRSWLQRERRLAALDAAIARGVSEADAKLGQDIEDVRQEMLERFGAKSSKSE